jgi:hypothetical protein
MSPAPVRIVCLPGFCVKSTPMSTRRVLHKVELFAITVRRWWSNTGPHPALESVH